MAWCPSFLRPWTDGPVKELQFPGHVSVDLFDSPRVAGGTKAKGNELHHGGDQQQQRQQRDPPLFPAGRSGSLGSGLVHLQSEMIFFFHLFRFSPKIYAKIRITR